MIEIKAARRGSDESLSDRGCFGLTVSGGTLSGHFLAGYDDGVWVAYEETMFGSVFDEFGWVGTGIILLLAAIIVITTAVTASGNPSDIRFSKSNWRPLLLAMLAVLGVLFGLTWSIAKVLPKCAVVEDHICWHAV